MSHGRSGPLALALCSAFSVADENVSPNLRAPFFGRIQMPLMGDGFFEGTGDSLMSGNEATEERKDEKRDR